MTIRSDLSAFSLIVLCIYTILNDMRVRLILKLKSLLCVSDPDNAMFRLECHQRTDRYCIPIYCISVPKTERNKLLLFV